MYFAATPWILVYFANQTMMVIVAVQRKIEHIAVSQYVQLLIPTIIGTTRWGKYFSDFRDPRLVRTEGGMLSRTVIALLSEVFQEVYSQDVLVFCDMLMHSWDAAQNMLVLQVIHSIDWDATFDG